MIKRVFLAAALFSGAAVAQQNADISETDFTSGAANAQLSALGRQAAASGKRLVVTAPQHWHARIRAAILAGGKADLVLKDGFYETALVRVEAKPEPEAPKPAAPPKPEVKPVIATPAQPEPRPVPPAAAPAPAKPIDTQVPPPPPVAPAPVVSAPAPAAVEPKAPEQAAPVAESRPVAEFDPAAFVGEEPGDVDPVRAALEKQYNEGRRVSELMVVKDLRNGDIIYVRGTAAVVVRRESGRMARYWLTGPVDLSQSGIEAQGSNKFRVLSPRVK